MNHQVSRDVTDAYLSTPALFDQLREAQRTVSDLIIRSAGQDPDERLTRLLLAGPRGGAVSPTVSPEYSVGSRNGTRRPIEKKVAGGTHQARERDHRHASSPSSPRATQARRTGLPIVMALKRRRP